MEYKSKVQQYFSSIDKRIYTYLSERPELRTAQEFSILKTLGLSILLVASILASKQIDNIHKKQSLENTLQQTQMYKSQSDTNYNRIYFK